MRKYNYHVYFFSNNMSEKQRLLKLT